MALQETINEMELDDHLADIIREKFNTAMEDEFAEYDPAIHGTNMSLISGHSSHGYGQNRFKVQGEDCKYNIINDNFFFNTGQYSLTLDTGEHKGEILTMVIVPHTNYLQRGIGHHTGKKLRKQLRNANRRK